jgi:hypothetical protein
MAGNVANVLIAFLSLPWLRWVWFWGHEDLIVSKSHFQSTHTNPALSDSAQDTDALAVVLGDSVRDVLLDME